MKNKNEKDVPVIDTLPWYKQFWPWFLIILPTCVVIASLTTFKIAMDNSDSLVAEEYYKQGKAINIDLAKTQYARQLGMNFLLEVDQNQLLISQQGGPAYQAGLKVKLYHPTQAAKDFEKMLSSDPSGVYRVQTDQSLTGNWEVRLESYDQKWRLHKRVELKDKQQYWFN